MELKITNERLVEKPKIDLSMSRILSIDKNYENIAKFMKNQVKDFVDLDRDDPSLFYD